MNGGTHHIGWKVRIRKMTLEIYEWIVDKCKRKGICRQCGNSSCFICSKCGHNPKRGIRKWDKYKGESKGICQN